MQLTSQSAPHYLPEANQHSVLRLGLHPLPTGKWLVLDDDFPLFQQHKLAVRQQLGDRVCAALSESGLAQRELREILVGDLLLHHAGEFARQGDGLHYRPTGLHWSLADNSLWQTSLLAQEDFCILEQRTQNYILTAASLCSPSNWKLEDKLGANLDVIHEPVPGYESQLAGRVNRLMNGIKVNKPLLRYNWSIQPGNELCWRDDVVPAGNSDNDYYWRVERQTLRRLPRSGAIVFGIRIFLHSFTVMNACTEFRDNITAILSRLPDAQLRYKGLESLREKIDSGDYSC